MAGANLARIFWIGAAALLCVAALIGLAALLGGNFSDTDWKVLATTGVIFLTGSTAVSGYALVERRRLVVLGWAAVGLAPIWFLILTAATWGAGGGEWKWTWTALTLPLAELVLLTNILMLRDSRFAALALGTSVALGLATLLVLFAIWSEGNTGSASAVGALLILTALGYFLLPILQRLAGVPPSAARAEAPPNAETVVARVEGLDLVAVPAGSEADGAPFVRGEDGRLTLVRGDHQILLPAGTVLVLRRSPEA
jgi:hypothetical protein